MVLFSLSGHHAPKHLLRCENPQTVYVTCPETGRHSLKIPLGVPQGEKKIVQGGEGEKLQINDPVSTVVKNILLTSRFDWT